jgi:hypothetical protein
MRHPQGCMTVTVALTLALTVSVAPVAWGDPLPLVRAEAAIAMEDCGLPLGAAAADPPPLARAEAAIWAENRGLSLSRAYAGRGFGALHTSDPGSPTTLGTIVRVHFRGA